MRITIATKKVKEPYFNIKPHETLSIWLKSKSLHIDAQIIILNTSDKELHIKN